MVIINKISLCTLLSKIMEGPWRGHEILLWSVTLVWEATKMEMFFEKPMWHVIKMSGQQLNSCLAAHQVRCGNTKV
jgi:hypothetical protein